MSKMRNSLKTLLIVAMVFHLSTAAAQTTQERERIKQFNAAVLGASEFLCTCLKPVYRTLGSARAQSERAIRSGDSAMLEKIRNRLQQDISLSQPCISELVQRFPLLNQSQLLQQRVFRAAEKQCPAPFIKKEGT